MSHNWMRNSFLLLVLVLAAALQGATTLTGTITSPLGGAATGTLLLTPPVGTRLTNVCGGSSGGAPPNATISIAVSAGALVSPPVIIGADCLLPTNSTYGVQFTDTGGNQFSAQWLITGATFDVSAQLLGFPGTVLPGMATGNVVAQTPLGFYFNFNRLKAILQFLPPNGTTLPATCAVGEVFFKTNASAGANMYGCTSLNTWTAQAGGGGGSATWGGITGTLSAQTDLNTALNAITEPQLSLTDITTANVSTSKHGFAPKAPNDATKYLDGTGVYSVPPGSGSGGLEYTASITSSSQWTLQAGNNTVGATATHIGTITLTTSGTTNTGTVFVCLNPSGALEAHHNTSTTITGVNITVVTASTSCGNFRPLYAFTMTANVPDALTTAMDLRSATYFKPSPTQGTCILVTPGSADAIGVDDTCATKKFIGAGAPTTVATSVKGDLYFDSSNSYAAYVCSSTQCATGSPTWNAIGGGGGGNSSSFVDYQKQTSTGFFALTTNTDTPTYTTNIVGGTMAAGHCLEIKALFKFETGASSTPGISYGGTVLHFSASTSSMMSVIATVCNDPGSTTSQQIMVFFANNANVGLAASIAIGTASVNSAANQTLALTNNPGAAPGTLTGFAWKVDKN